MLDGRAAYTAEMELTWTSVSRWDRRTDLRHLAILLLMQWMTPFSGRCEGGLGTDKVDAKRDRGGTPSATLAGGSSASLESAWCRAAPCNLPASTMLTRRWLPCALANCGAGPARVAVSRYG